MHDPSSKNNPDSSARPIPRPLDVPPVVYPAAVIGDSPAQDATERGTLVSANLNRELLQRAHQQARERQQNRGYSISSEPEPEPSREPDPAPVPERDAIVISNKYVPPSRQLRPDEQAELPFTFADATAESKFDELVPRADAPIERTWIEETAPDVPAAAQPHRDIGTEAVDDEIAWSAPTPEPPAASRYRPPVEFEYERPIQRPVRQRDRVPEPIQAAERYVDEADLFDPGYDDVVLPEPVLAEHETWPAPGDVGVWAGIVRTCRTCRDFRPAGDGQRGWCTNQWAFKHRRMVDAQDRPCETSIGNWWIPGDEAWQGVIDISTLGQPTPLVDKFLRPAAAEVEDDQPSIPRRRHS